MNTSFRNGLVAVCVTVLLAACGGGGDEDSSSGGGGTSGPNGTAPPPVNDKPSSAEAARFLQQATFGPTDASIVELTTLGYSAWFDKQFALPQEAARSHAQYVDDVAAAGTQINASTFYESWWRQAVMGDDQLRQRASYALSQILVISFQDPNLQAYTRGVSSYYDMLGKHAFGNYRNLLEEVTLSPMMGIYLSHRGNRKTTLNTATQQVLFVPDENYAREIMQLFSIGLYQMDANCNVRTGADGKALETYQHSPDIVGLSRVFTGFSWYAGENLADRTEARFLGRNAAPGRERRAMQSYANFHETMEKTFLGTTIPASAAVNPEGDLKAALDTIFNHPNVGCFIGERLIKHFVTSNPSRAYVARVANAFNGANGRGDMKATLKAVLLDPEARTFNAASTSAGKVREPVLRLAHLMRSMNGKSQSNRFLIRNLDDPGLGDYYLGQNPMFSPTVFNFFKPQYVKPNSESANANLTAPELQIASEVTVAAYLNRMRNWIQSGIGDTPDGGNGRDVQFTYDTEVSIAGNAQQLADRMDLLLMGGTMPADMKTELVRLIGTVNIPNATGSNQQQVLDAQRNRVRLAVYYTMGSPSYIVQK